MTTLAASGAPWPPGSGRPTVSMPEATELALDLGDGRIGAMDAAGIERQVVSYTTPVQLRPIAPPPRRSK